MLNADGTLSTETDYNGHAVTMGYDNAGWLVSKSDSTGTLYSCVYNPDGTLQSTTKYSSHGNVTTSYAYDSQGRTASVTTANTNGLTSTVSYIYDAAGNKKTQTTASGTLTYDYDADERLQYVHFSTAGIDETSGTITTSYNYDNAGNRHQVIRANGNTTTCQYDQLNRLTDLLNQKGTTTVSEYNYTLYPSGKRHIINEYGLNGVLNNSITNSYDADSKLTEENGTLSGDIVYHYDAVGNRLTKSVNGSTVQSFTFDPDDRITNSGYSYDGNGNVLSDGAHTYKFDWENRLITSDANTANQINYTYNSDGLRVQQQNASSTINYTVDPDSGYGNVVEERDGSGNLIARYDSTDDGELIDMQRGGTTSWYLFDGHGSTRQFTNNSGTVTDTYSYDACGDLIAHSGSTNNPYLYDAQCQDSTGLYYLRARYMDPTRGEFESQDPFDGDSEDPITLHRYLYAGDDPADIQDPGGQDWLDALVGTYVGTVIGDDFIETGLGRISNFSIGSILGGSESTRPDLVDPRVRHLWEIKSAATDQIGIGEAQLTGYVLMMNAISRSLPLWWYGGMDYYYDSATMGNVIPVPDFGCIAVVFPPINGVITYKTVSKLNPLWQLEVACLSQSSSDAAAFELSGVAPAVASIGIGSVAITAFPSIEAAPFADSIAQVGARMSAALSFDNSRGEYEWGMDTLATVY